MSKILALFMGIVVFLICPMFNQEAEVEIETKLSPPKTGVFWYSVSHTDQNEDLKGYARLAIEKEEFGEYFVEWEWHVYWKGEPKEEGRILAFAPDFSLLHSMLIKDGEDVANLTLEDESYITQTAAAEAEPVEFSSDGITGLPFLFAAMASFEMPSSLTRVHYDDTQGFKKLGTVNYTVGEPKKISWEGKEVSVREVQVELKDSYALQVGVTEDRAIAYINQDGQKMMLSSRNTEDLFLSELEKEQIDAPVENGFTMPMLFPTLSAEALFDHFTKPDLVKKWWSPQAEIELTEGGIYRLTWPEEKKEVIGSVKSFEPGKTLVLSLKWDDDPADAPMRNVSLEFAPMEGGGSTITINETGYTDSPEDQKVMEIHLQAWQGRLIKLMELF